MSEMRRTEAQEQAERQTRDRFASTLVIAAAIIAAVRLARDADITHSSPRLFSVVGDSVALARLILKRVIGTEWDNRERTRGVSEAARLHIPKHQRRKQDVAK